MKKIAFIGTGGTISSRGAHPLDVLDYDAIENRMTASETIAMYPDLTQVAEIIPIDYRAMDSTAVGFADWKALVLACDKAVASIPDLSGIVIGHGTASLEETAYFLNLTLAVDLPVVITGSQRPSSALGTDAGPNLVAAVRTAASAAARDKGVLVVMNEEIQAAREVTKTSTLRMHSFRTPDFGILGHADADRVSFYRAPTRRHAPGTEFDVRGMDGLPRVDIAYAHSGSDGTAIRGFVASGARGIVSAGFAPNAPTPADVDALTEARAAGLVVVQSTRSGSGRVFRSREMVRRDFLSADNLNPQKARILLQLSLAMTADSERIEAIFEEY